MINVIKMSSKFQLHMDGETDNISRYCLMHNFLYGVAGCYKSEFNDVSKSHDVKNLNFDMRINSLIHYVKDNI